MKYIIIILTLFFLLSFTALSAFGAKPAARMGDTTSHGGTITQGSPNVLIGGKPAARIGDYASCPQVDVIGLTVLPHVGGTIITGSNRVLINGKPSARIGDFIQETGGTAPISTIVSGSSSVIIGD